MQLIDRKQLRTMVLYSRAHIQRLEDAGLFPRRVRLGQGRVAWIKAEVEEWIAARVRDRGLTYGSVSREMDDEVHTKASSSGRR